MAEYLVLIYEDESAMEGAGEEVFKEMMNGHEAFGARHGASIRGGNALQPSSTATSLRGDGSGGFSITDGAFSETKEALGGYYLLEAVDLDEAIALAKAIPTFQSCGVWAALSLIPLRHHMVPPAGFEPATHGLGNRRSIP